MIQVIASDFARLGADTKSSEATAQKEHDTFMTDSSVDKESKSQDIERKTTKKQGCLEGTRSGSKELECTNLGCTKVGGSRFGSKELDFTNLDCTKEGARRFVPGIAWRCNATGYPDAAGWRP